MNYFLLFHTWIESKWEKKKTYKLMAPAPKEYLDRLKASVQKSKAQAVIASTYSKEKVDQSEYFDQYQHNHLLKINEEEFISVGKGSSVIYNHKTNKFIKHFDFNDDQLNAFNYARYKSMHVIMPEDGRVMLMCDKSPAVMLSEYFSNSLSYIDYANTSRCVEFHGENLYFIDRDWNLVFHRMDTLLDRLKKGEKDFKGEILRNYIVNFCLNEHGDTLYIADDKRLVHKHKSKLVLQFKEDERVIAMVAQFGLLVIVTMNVTEHKRPGNTNTYYIHSQRNLDQLHPPFKKVNDKYRTNMIQKVILHRISRGLIMVGLPNFQFCDIFFIAKNQLVVLQKDKPNNEICHWTAVICQIDDKVSVFLGTLDKLFKIEFAV